MTSNCLASTKVLAAVGKAVTRCADLARNRADIDERRQD